MARVRITFVASVVVALAFTAQAHALYANRNLFWKPKSGHPVTIRVCWENPGAASVARRAWVQTAVEASWQRHARVNFIEWDTCSPGDPGVHVRIADVRPSAPGGVLLNGATDGATLNLSFNAFGPAGCRMSEAAREHCVRATAVHEFGHVLGYYHEEERPDYVPLDASAACADQDYENAKPQYYGAYDVHSVMSYCGQPGDQPETWKDGLSPGDVAAVQRTYGRRIAGSMVSPGGRCLASHAKATSGEPAFLWWCDEAANDQEWRWWPLFEHLMLGKSRCLATATGIGAEAARIEACDPVRSLQRWVFTDVAIRGWGGLCLDLRGGDTSDGTPVQMWTCGALRGMNQRWTYDPATGRILYGSSGKCLTVPPSGQAHLAACVLPDLQRFKLATGGRIKLLKGGRCLDVKGWKDAEYRAGQGLPFDGETVQAFKCIGKQLNQRWHLHGKLHQAATGLCLDRLGNGDADGTPIQSYPSNESGAQEWEYYLRR